MASADNVGTVKVVLGNSSKLRDEQGSDNYFITYSLSFSKGNSKAKEAARKHLDHYQYIWYWQNPNGVWFTGESSTTTSTKLSYAPPSNAVKIKVKIRAIAKKYKPDPKKSTTKPYWATTAYAESKTYILRDILNPPELEVSLVDTVDSGVKMIKAQATVDTTNLKVVQPNYVDYNHMSFKDWVMVYFKAINVDTQQVFGIARVRVRETYSSALYNPIVITYFDFPGPNGQTGLNPSHSGKTNINIPYGTHVGFSVRVVQGPKDLLEAGTTNNDKVTTSEYGDLQVILTRPGSTTIKSVIPTRDYESVTGGKVVRVDWEPLKNVESYTLYYTKNKDFFTGAPGSVQSVSDIKATYTLLTDIEPGSAYWFMITASNESGEGARSPIYPNNNVGIIVGEKPAPPTTWSSTTTTIIGSELYLYWVHNSKDGSSETQARIQIFKGDIEPNEDPLLDYIQKNDKIDDIEHRDDTKFYPVDTIALNNEAGGGLTDISWRVQTMGIYNEYSDWSIVRKIDIFEPPTIESVFSQEKDGLAVETINQFPFYLQTITYPPTQIPIGYSVEVRAFDGYTTINDLGEEVSIAANQIIFSSFYDTNEILELEFTPDMIDLEPGQSYKLFISAAMNSGLSADNYDNPIVFNVDWYDSTYQPYLEVEYNNSDYTTSLTPYCYPPGYKYIQVVETPTGWEKIEDEYLDLPIPYNSEALETYALSSTIDETTEIYYWPLDDLYFTQVTYDGNELIDYVTLSVYRKNYDGTFSELISGLENNRITINDPHPSLDYARYRVVATDKNTGAISWEDVDPYPIQEKSLILQWDESTSTYIQSVNEDVVYSNGEGGIYIESSEVSEMENEEERASSWVGSLLKLPFNIDLNSSYNPEVNHVEYSGRSHPVAYYGTQIGETASWSADIDKKDTETLFLLRRLARYMGNVYVREPYGSGYWATVTVSFSQTHKELVTPVSLEITRVDSQEV